jgi:hypothetical protein
MICAYYRFATHSYAVGDVVGYAAVTSGMPAQLYVDSSFRVDTSKTKYLCIMIVGQEQADDIGADEDTV